MTDITIRDVVRDPSWLPHGFDPDGEALTLVRVPSEARAQLRFLFDEQYRGRFAKASFAGGAMAAAVDAELGLAGAAPLNFIFHTAFCGSTLLAKALEVPGVASSLREPAIFTNLANRVTPRTAAAGAAQLELVLRLIERPMAGDEAVIVKQSNFANRMIDGVMQARDHSRSLLLHSDVETYLISLLKRGLGGRIWGRKLFTTLAKWSRLDLGLGPDDLLELTDMQVAALAWLVQIHHFQSLAGTFGSRVMMLNSNAMFAAPAATLHRVMTFFELGVTEGEAADIAAGPIFAKHSKFTSRDYSIEQRRLDSEAVGAANAEELSMVTKWIDAFAAHHGIELGAVS